MFEAGVVVDEASPSPALAVDLLGSAFPPLPAVDQPEVSTASLLVSSAIGEVVNGLHDEICMNVIYTAMMVCVPAFRKFSISICSYHINLVFLSKRNQINTTTTT